MTDKSIHIPLNRPPGQLRPLAALLACLLLSLSFPQQSFAGEDPVIAFDEILVYVNLQGVGGTQIPAAIYKETAWLSVIEIFDFLKIKNTPSRGLDSVSGFFITPKAPFLIDKIHNLILYQGKTIELPKDALIRTITDLYLRADYFGLVFGLDCKFNFRNLSVILHSKTELPVMREIRQEAIYKNLNKLKGENMADTILRRTYPFFGVGMVDWAVVATENAGGPKGIQGDQQTPGDIRLGLGLGGVLAGGSMNVALNYDNKIPFSEREQYYQWRHVDNDRPALRQVMAGKIFSPSVSSIYSPLVGVQATNAPTTYRRSFGTYNLPYYCELDWMVELYVNGELVNYAKAAVSGFFNFQVPLVYGTSVVTLRFYSPWGEERTTQENIQIPFTFLPLHEFEYTATAGVVEDSVNSRFSRTVANYGLTKRLTVGGGFEYNSSITTGKGIPFVGASFRLSSNLLLAEEYAIGVRSKLIASYRLPSDLQIELDYIRYKEGQKAINNTFREERRAILSYPFRGRKFTLYSRLSLYEIVLPSSKYTTAEGLLSGALFGVATNLTTYALFIAQSSPYVYSNLSLAYRLPGKIIFTPQVQYEYNHSKVMNIRSELGKYLNARGYLNFFYEKNFIGHFENFGIGLRYDFSAAFAGISVTHSNNTTTMVESASGSMLYDGRNKYLDYSNRSSVDKGGLYIIPYLDINGNGRRDPGEPKVAGLSVRINGGRIKYNLKDTTIRVSNLVSYAQYILTLDPSFEDIAWHIKNKTISIAIDPNQFKLVEVPVIIVGEVAGMAYLTNQKYNSDKKYDSSRDTKEDLQPQDRVIINFYRNDSSLAGQSITESDGTFDFFGLPPGTYQARINQDQLKKLNMISIPPLLPFTILPKRTGDVVDGLKFILQALPDTIRTTFGDQETAPTMDLNTPPAMATSVKPIDHRTTVLRVQSNTHRLHPATANPAIRRHRPTTPTAIPTAHRQPASTTRPNGILMPTTRSNGILLPTITVKRKARRRPPLAAMPIANLQLTSTV